MNLRRALPFLSALLLIGGLYWFKQIDFDSNPYFGGLRTSSADKKASSECLCEAENYCFLPKTSKRFDCALKSHLDALKFPLDKPKPDEKVTFVTACSDNHFGELKILVGMTQKAFPESRIVFYDLGIPEAEVKNVAKYCNVEYRAFPFKKYEAVVPSVNQINEFRWKPLIIAEMMKEASRLYWLDTSIRWKDNAPAILSELQYMINNGTKGPILFGDWTGHSSFAATNPKMYEYLSVTNEEEFKKVWMMGASHIYFERGDTAWDVLKWTVLCALTKDCMAPPNSPLGCSFQGEPMRRYAGCHRFDQSAFNLAVSRHFHYNQTLYQVHKVIGEVTRSADRVVEPKLCS